MTTDEMDKITVEERSALVGYCEEHNEFIHFTRGKSKEECPKCHEAPSTVIGLQVVSQRTFDLARSKKEAAKYRKKVGKR